MPANDGTFYRAPAARPHALVAMPGTGSDADFISRAFGPACTDLGIELIALDPTDDLIDGHRQRLTEVAAQYRHILVGGVSIGAALAVEWALGNSARCDGVWAALPAWSGPATDALAAASAAATAALLRADGLAPSIQSMRSSSPAWLADELERSWSALHPGLVSQLEQAARYCAPELDAIADLGAPLGLVAAPDDPLHPLDVAASWAAAAPRAQLIQVTLNEWGHHPELLGRACASAWEAASAQAVIPPSGHLTDQ